MTREELRELKWTYDKTGAMIDGPEGALVADVWTSGHDANMDAAGQLLAAAPALALVCLEAREAVHDFLPRFCDGPEGHDAHGTAVDLLLALDAALALAGVEVSCDETLY